MIFHVKPWPFIKLSTVLNVIYASSTTQAFIKNTKTNRISRAQNVNSKNIFFGNVAVTNATYHNSGFTTTIFCPELRLSVAFYTGRNTDFLHIFIYKEHHICYFSGYQHNNPGRINKG